MSGTSSSASAGRAPLTYSSYLRLEGLRSQQAPLTASHDEPLFIVIHQASELWLKLSLHELRAARTCISQDDVRPALKMLARVAGFQKQSRTATGTCTSSARNLSTWKIVSNSGAMRTCARSSLIIGRRRGTGGTPGVPYLARVIEQKFFPERYSLRTTL